MVWDWWAEAWSANGKGHGTLWPVLRCWASPDGHSHGPIHSVPQVSPLIFAQDRKHCDHAWGSPFVRYVSRYLILGSLNYTTRAYKTSPFCYAINRGEHSNNLQLIDGKTESTLFKAHRFTVKPETLHML